MAFAFPWHDRSKETHLWLMIDRISQWNVVQTVVLKYIYCNLPSILQFPGLFLWFQWRMVFVIGANPHLSKWVTSSTALCLLWRHRVRRSVTLLARMHGSWNFFPTCLSHFKILSWENFRSRRWFHLTETCLKTLIWMVQPIEEFHWRNNLFHGPRDHSISITLGMVGRFFLRGG